MGLIPDEGGRGRGKGEGLGETVSKFVETKPVPEAR